jgi:uncharacterized protein YfaS (alpha-2-macroglobulin family)
MTEISKNRVRAIGSVAVLFLIVFLYSMFHSRPIDAAGEFTGLTAVHLNNQLQINIPFDKTAPSSPGTLAVELLDAEDRVVSRQLLAPDSKTTSSWRGKLMLPAGLKRDDLVWHRLRYRFIPQNQVISSVEAIHTVGEILRYPVVKLLGQKDLLSGSTNTLRVIAVDGRTGAPLEGTLQLELKTPKKGIESARAELDSHGTAEPRLKTPDFSGQAELKINVTTPLGNQEIVQQVNVVERENILLTTDKPIYQPGHLIHIRSLALDRFSRQAVAGQQLIFEIEDAKGNKVFKQRVKTDEFGVASAQFQLADEVNMGTFKLRAILGDPDSGQANTQERSFVVDRYVLPKFKIEIKLRGGEDERQQKKYYAPGETVTGRITAKYLFGKPISKGRVNIKLSTFDVETVELSKVEALTNETGEYSFSMKLPNSFAGRSFEQGAAPVALQVEVTDSANHTESRAESLLVSSNPILITAVPESGDVVPKLTNRVYLLTSYPDGTPARTSISGNFKPAVLTTDKDGIATIEVDGSSVNQLKLRAQDENGKVGVATIALKKRAPGEESLMLRTDRAIYQVGEKLEITAISTKTRGSIYIDVIKDRQTILTRALDLTEGRAKMALDLSADLFGTIEVRAYIFGRDADPISDRRIIFVDPADDLQIETALSKESFRPGEDAQINISVRDKLGKPKFAVLDVQVVDEAVFALSERQPGFEKVFFYLEQELLKPRYEIHSIGSDDIVPLPGAEPQQEAVKRERAAQVLLAAASEVNSYSLKGDYGRDQLQAKSGEYYQKYYQLTSTRLERAIQGLNKYYAQTRETTGDLSKDLAKAVEAKYVTRQDSIDPWGRAINFNGQVNGNQVYFNAAIDWPGDKDQKFWFSLYGVKTQTATTEQKPFTGQVKVNAGAATIGNYAQLAGRILKSNNQPIANATIKVQRRDNGKAYTLRSDQGGAFQFNALAAGSYEISILAAGHYGTSHRWIELNSRDQAYVEVALQESNSGAVMQLQFNPYYGNVAKNGIRRRAGQMAVMEGMVAGAVMDKAMPMPAAAPAEAQQLRAMSADKKEAEKNKRDDLSAKDSSREADEAGSGSGGGGGEGTRVRSYFPETLYVNPVLITDKQGRAMIRIPMADSITTWRMTMLASTKNGSLGSGTAGIKVFQDFFIDLDLPVTLTQEDTVSVPVAVYNYLSDSQEVELKLQLEDWFTLVDDEPVKVISLDAGEVSAVSYRIRAARIGTQKLTVTARLTRRNSAANGDAIARQIEVIPNGEQQNIAVNDRLEGSVTKEIAIPATAIADASKILVKFYPGPLSQVVEGLDSILRMPNGCFEQTSSATYPNILVMDYMKSTKRITPEIQAKAEGFISLGYQKLVTFEVPGGGFSWFGQAPANKILTSFGLMEFADMSKVHEVDPRLLERTQAWLASQQKGDGSWDPDKDFIDEGATNNFHNDKVRIAAYIGWALVYSGYRGEAVERAKQYVDKNLNGQEDTYTLAIIANFAADLKQDRAWTDRMLGSLANKATEREKVAFWPVGGERTPMHAHGDMAELETTALAAQALIKWGRNATLATKALQFLTEKKDAFGNWQSTQATILALKAFLLSQQQGTAADTEGTISVAINGQQVREIAITKDNNDLMHQIDLKQFTATGRNQIELRYTGKGSLLYQIVGRYYKPWERKLNAPIEPLSIDVKYDRTKLEQDDIASATVTVKNNLRQSANMVMIDLGIPPGFEVLAEDFQDLIGANVNDKFGHLTKFTVTAKQATLYLDGLRAGQSMTIKYRLKAKYPIKAKTFASKVYEYYNPAVGSTSQPVDISVIEKGKK